MDWGPFGVYMEQPLSVGKSVKAQVTFLNPSGWVGKLLGEGQLAWGGEGKVHGTSCHFAS